MSIADDVKQCKLCDICKNMPHHPLTGYGNPKAKIIIVGEAPGEDEAIVNEPFVGMCGKVLDRMLLSAGIDRKQLYITNTVKCRPVDGKKNRSPTTNEIKNCLPFLLREIKVIKPNFVITLGKVPTYCLSQHTKSITSFKLLDYVHKIYRVEDSINYIALYHPSYIMQYGKDKFQETVDTLTRIQKILEIPNVI